MHINFDHTDSPETLRAISALCLILAGDRPQEASPQGDMLTLAEHMTTHNPLLADLPVVEETPAPKEPATTDDGVSPQPSGESSAADARVDMHGVVFDERFCANAKEPFYATGKMSGQWKCKRGVTSAEYDVWYAEQLESGPDEELEVDTSAAFAKHDDTADAAAAFAPPATEAAAAPAPAPGVPTDSGTLMVWVAEQQAAGNLTQERVAQAYGQLQLTLVDLFPPNDAATVAARVAALYELLQS